ncbi:MAG: TlpA family protein disulfide reductase [Gammaproteobacteria bacterium]|nr:TlpA family protein disulfide reductase [Gammaproteobacteria bacterium]
MSTIRTYLILSILLLLHLSQVGARELLKSVDDPSQAPDFLLHDINGEKQKLQDFQGKVLVVNFWATWCPPCREEMPSLERARDILRDDGVEVITIDVGEKAAAIERFLKRSPLSLPILLDSDTETASQWGAKGLPTTLIVDRQGRFSYIAIGGREWDSPEILATIRTLANEPLQTAVR